MWCDMIAWAAQGCLKPASRSVRRVAQAGPLPSEPSFSPYQRTPFSRRPPGPGHRQHGDGDARRPHHGPERGGALPREGARARSSQCLGTPPLSQDLPYALRLTCEGLLGHMHPPSTRNRTNTHMNTQPHIVISGPALRAAPDLRGAAGDARPRARRRLAAHQLHGTPQARPRHGCVPPRLCVICV